MRRAVVLLVAVVVAACSSPAAEDDEAASCPSPAIAPGQAKVTLRVGGAERWYLRRVPPAHDGERRVPAVIDLHGYLEGAEIHAVHTALGDFGDEKGFVTLTPQGSGTDVVRWDPTAGSEDVRFVGALLDDLERTLCIDPRRVYVTGLSNGAMMASRLACAFAGRLAAVAPVAGVTDPAPCRPARPVRVVAFHGTDDRFLPYGGGVGEGALDLPLPDGSGRRVRDVVAGPLALPSVPDSMSAWARRNGCDVAVAPTEELIAPDVTRVTHECPDGAEVALYRVDGGGHTWPGSAFSQSLANIVGRTTTSISANEVMWEFFQR